MFLLGQSLVWGFYLLGFATLVFAERQHFCCNVPTFFLPEICTGLFFSRGHILQMFRVRNCSPQRRQGFWDTGGSVVVFGCFLVGSRGLGTNEGFSCVGCYVGDFVSKRMGGISVFSLGVYLPFSFSCPRSRLSAKL